MKYRAWIQKWEDAISINPLGFYEMYEWHPEFFSDMSPVTGYGSEIDPDVILMQYIGLNDCNGKEIYEGDIVEIDSKMAKTKTKGEVFYNKDVAAFVVDDTVFKQYIPITKYDKIEVIGNYYESK